MADILTHPWEYAVAPFNIAGDLYYVGNSNVSSHLIDTGAGLVLIDTVFPQSVYLLLESIRRLGFDPDEIQWLVHVHAHYDHCGGTRALVELTGAQTALGAEDIAIVRDEPELTWAADYGAQWHVEFEVDLALNDGDAIALGDTRIECVHCPGHTPGTMSYFFTVEDGGETLRVGMHGGPGINTLTDAYMQEHNLPASRRDEYLDSLARLREREVDIFIGAHPGQSRTLEKQAARAGECNPFIAPDDWLAYLDELEAEARRAWG